MSENKKTVERYIDGFRATDHALILSCLTDDVEWEMPGAFHVTGKEDHHMRDGKIRQLTTYFVPVA